MKHSSARTSSHVKRSHTMELMVSHITMPMSMTMPMTMSANSLSQMFTLHNDSMWIGNNFS